MYLLLGLMFWSFFLFVCVLFAFVYLCMHARVCLCVRCLVAVFE